MVGEMKAKIDSKELCKGMPEEFAKILEYVKKIHFKSAPDYNFLIKEF